jgi:DNA-directed RNA polymerase specialized sigma24 family protein
MTHFAERGGQNEPSFESFAAGCGTRLIRAAYLLCGDHQLAEELWQMTMMRTARRRPAARSAPEPYAQAVRINLARDHARRGRRRVDEAPIEAEAGRGEPWLAADRWPRSTLPDAPWTPAPTSTRLINEQLLAGATWYGPGGRVIAKFSISAAEINRAHSAPKPPAQ